MTILLTLKGPDAGRHFPLSTDAILVGRQLECPICLSGRQVSRQHAKISSYEGSHFVEDLGSSNGTYVNGRRLAPHAPEPITERDTLQIGPYVFGLRRNVAANGELDPSPTVRETVAAGTLHQSLFTPDSAAKLQVVLDIAQHLARTLDIDALLEKLLSQLMKLFPQADRCLVILKEGDRLMPRAKLGRNLTDEQEYVFSRTIVQRALEEGVGILSEDVQHDERFLRSQTITSLNLHSMMCAPLISNEGTRLGVIQVDRFCKGFGFRREDLHLLNAIAMQVTVVLENVRMHAERLKEERLVQELALAQEIQQSYLPDEVDDAPRGGCEVAGRLYPARTVAGDFYDYFQLPDGRFAFFIGDVSGKGMPAALFLVAVRTLSRHLAKEASSPANLMTRLDAALSVDNSSFMFVTLVHGVFDPVVGSVVLASAGHPAPILRKAQGGAAPVELKPSRMLGYADAPLRVSEVTLPLEVGDTLVHYTDGLIEARGEDRKTQFGLARLVNLVDGFAPERDLGECAEELKSAVDRFSGASELRDDLTLLLLRRTRPSAALGETTQLQYVL